LSSVFGSIIGTEFCAAQVQPTATEAFHLRRECKELADKKAEELLSVNPKYQELVTSYSRSKIDPKNSRCYIEIFKSLRYGPRREHAMQIRQIYDGLTDDLLAFAKIDDQKKVGLIFDDKHVADAEKNLGWDDANDFIDKMMHEER
jgi:hypothetical protein